jgi:protein gp37
VGENTGVEYVKHSFSPWWGCARKSPGCRNCFAETLASRWGHDLWHLNGPRRIVSEGQWRNPLKWNREARLEGVRARVLCGTMCDVLEDHPQVGAARARLFRLIEQTPWLLWFLFTKEPHNAGAMIPWGDAWPGNVGLVASVETQDYADGPHGRIPHLLATAAPVKGLSVEPLLGPVDLSSLTCPGCGGRGRRPDGVNACRRCGGTGTGPGLLDWIIIGGESGAKARPMHPQWALDLYRQCQGKVPVWFKQWGSWGPAEWVPSRAAGESWEDYKARAAATAATHAYPVTAHLNGHRPVPAGNRPWSAQRAGLGPEGVPIRRWGKGRAGHLLGGREITELPRAAYLTPEAVTDDQCA